MVFSTRHSIPTPYRALLAAVLMATTTWASATAAQPAVWYSGTGNWTDTGKWTYASSSYPHNGNGGFNWDADIRGGTVTVNVPIEIQRLVMSGSELNIASDLTIKDVFAWNGGILTGSAKLSTEGGLVIGGSFLGGQRLSRDIENSGYAKWTDLASVTVDAGCKFTNTTTGTFEITSGQMFSGAGALFENHGTMLKTTYASGSIFQMPFINTGVVNIQQGPVYFAQGGSSSGSPVTGSAGRVVISGPNPFTITNPNSIPTNVTVSSGRLNLPGDNTLSSYILEDGGTLAGPGTTFVPTGAKFRSTSGKLVSRDLDISGTLELGSLNAATSHVLNRQGGRIVSGSQSSLTCLTLDNEGVIYHSSSDGWSGWIGWTVNNTGVIDVAKGPFSLATIHNPGMIKVAEGGLTCATLYNTGTTEVTAGTLSLKAGSTSGIMTLGPAATLELPSATFTVDNPSGFSVSRVLLSGGTLDYPGDCSFKSLEWRSGNISGPGKVIVPADGVLQLGTSSSLSSIETARHVENHGNAIIRQSLKSTSVEGLTNADGAQLELAGAILDYSATRPVLRNEGAIKVTGSSHVHWRLESSGSLTLDGSLTLSGGGTLTGPVNLSSSGSLYFSGKDFSVSNITGPGSINVRDAANVTVSEGIDGMFLSVNAKLTTKRFRLTSEISIWERGEAVILPDGTDAATCRASRIRENNVNVFAPPGKLDLNNNALIIDGPAQYATDVPGLLAAGYNGGAWNGRGIMSSMAAADPTRLSALGVLLNNDGSGQPLHSVFHGLDAPLNARLVAFTVYGDADLDGLITDRDYSLLDAGLAGSLSGWWNGDFNYSGLINFLDYALIDHVADRQDNPLASLMIAEHTTRFGQPYVDAMAALAVPEPATALCLGVGLITMFRRRRVYAATIKQLTQGIDRRPF